MILRFRVPDGHFQNAAAFNNSLKSFKISGVQPSVARQQDLIMLKQPPQLYCTYSTQPAMPSSALPSGQAFSRDVQTIGHQESASVCAYPILPSSVQTVQASPRGEPSATLDRAQMSGDQSRGHEHNVHASRWVPARSYRYSPYPQPASSRRDPEPSPNLPPLSAPYGVAPPLQLPTTPMLTGVAYGQRDWSRRQAVPTVERIAGPSPTSERRTTLYLSPCNATQQGHSSQQAHSPPYEAARTSHGHWGRYGYSQEPDPSERDQGESKVRSLSTSQSDSPLNNDHQTTLVPVQAPQQPLAIHHGGHHVAQQGLATGHPCSSDIFERVQGRFSLLGSSNKYNVTIGEIQRRINPPECLNTSLLGGLLRRGKGKNGGTDLRQKLEAVGLVLPPGRRKATSVSMLTSLVEAEAKDLSSQFTKVCQAIFPSEELAQVAYQSRENARHHRSGGREELQKSVKASLNLAGEFREVLEHYLAQEEMDRGSMNTQLTGLRSFSLITHSFGIPTITGCMSVFQNYLSSLLALASGGLPAVESDEYRPHYIAHHPPQPPRYP